MNTQQPQGRRQQPPPGRHPGYPSSPPKKNKAPLIVGISLGVTMLAGAGVAASLYFGNNADGGTAKRGGTMPGVCAEVAEAALARARTTNPNPAMSRETKTSVRKQTSCAWSQTKGVDGSGLRNADAYVVAGDADREYEQRVSQSKLDNQGTINERTIDGLGDQATAVLVDGTSAFLQVDIIVRKGDTVIEFETAARGIAEDLLAKA